MAVSVAPIQLPSSYFRLGAGNTLSITILEPILVMFKMDACPGCRAVEPIFFQLANEDRRIRYGMHNVTTDPTVPRISASTKSPVKTVPVFLLFMNGVAVAKFNGKKNLPSLKSFISNALRSLSGAQSPQPPSHFSPPPHQQMRPPAPMYDQSPFQHAPPGRALPGGGGKAFPPSAPEEDDHVMKVPSNVTPHNTPWEAGRLGEGDVY